MGQAANQFIPVVFLNIQGWNMSYMTPNRSEPRLVLILTRHHGCGSNVPQDSEIECRGVFLNVYFEHRLTGI